ncbi:MAG TPA: isoprenylcysteine carboxylmethyltransferase family protein [Candidatus Binatus sp.]|nr:isoprenylcysteine carboxylmethyltransferase family protein [Candidatus Binatus sp.]
MRLLRWPAWVFGTDGGLRRARPPERLVRRSIDRVSVEERLRPHRVRVGLPLAVACVVLAHPTSRSMVVGGCLALAGLLVRAAAAGHLSKHATLTTSGPYAVIRHPLYLGSVVVAAGLLVAAHSWLAAIFVAAYLAVFYPLAMRREEEKLGRRHGPVFEEYAARVSGLRPRSMRAGVSTWQFSWGLYRYNGEFQSALGVLAALAVLWLRMRGVPGALGR